MELFEAIKKRTSVREFNGEAPSKAEIEAVLEAAYHAPALFTTKNAHISVITDKALLAELDRVATAKFKNFMDIKNTLYGAPVLIQVSAKMFRETPAGWESSNPLWLNNNAYWAVGSMLQNMHLAATALGLVACPINTANIALYDEPELAKKLGIQEGYTPLCALALGKGEFVYQLRQDRKDHYSVSYI